MAGQATNQQDLLVTLNARIAKETAELADLRAKVAKELERKSGSDATNSMTVNGAVVLGRCDLRHSRSFVYEGVQHPLVVLTPVQ